MNKVQQGAEPGILFPTAAIAFRTLLVLLSCTGPAIGAEPNNPHACPTFQQPVVLGEVDSKKIDEASGIAASHRNPGVYYVHNDSGSSARFFAVDETGHELGRYKLPDATSKDWEDIAVGKAHGNVGTYIYVGDIGDNRKRRDWITVYRVPEPDISLNPLQPQPTNADGSKKPHRLTGSVALRMRYPDGLVYDSEALLLDPASSDLYLITKSAWKPPKLFRYPAPHKPGEIVTLEEVGSFEVGKIGKQGRGLITGGDISLVRNQIVLRTYSQVHVWRPRSGQSVAQTLADPPCWSANHKEPQGEAVAWKLDGSGFVTVSEKKYQPIYFFANTPAIE